MPHIEVSKLLRFSRNEVYPFIKDMEKYSDFMDNVTEVRVLERDLNKTITAWKVSVEGIKVDWIEEDIFDEEEKWIKYKQIEGDFSVFIGEWNLEDRIDGTLVKLIVDVDLGISMLTGFINPILSKKVHDNSMKMLEAIEKQLIVKNLAAFVPEHP